MSQNAFKMISNFYIQIFFIGNLMDYLFANSNLLFLVESNGTSLICPSSTLVLWQRKTIVANDYEEIFLQGVIVDSFVERFNVTPSHNLVIKNVQMEDAGIYRCTDNNGFGNILQLYDLVILASMSCNSNKDVAVGLNSCNIKPSFVDYNCSVVYNGSEQPTLTWIDLSAGDLINNSFNEFTTNELRSSKVQIITSKIRMEAKMAELNMQCAVENLMICKTIPVPVHYALESNIQLSGISNASDHVKCHANSSGKCTYRWSQGDKTITYEQNPPVKLLAASVDLQSSSNFTCSATCTLALQQCNINVLTVEIVHMSGDQDGLQPAILAIVASISISAFLLSLILISLVLKKYFKCRKWGFKRANMTDPTPFNSSCFQGEDLDAIEDIPLPLSIIRSARKYTDRPAFIDPILHKSILYKDVNSLIERVAKGLWFDFLVRQETLVGVVLPNCIQYPIIFHAILHIGAVCVPILYVSTPDELKSCLVDSNVEFVITTSENKDKCESLLQRKAFRIILIEDKLGSNLPSLEKYFNTNEESQDNSRQLPKIKIFPSTTAAISYSSGTTGIPKGCAHTHRSYLANLKQMCHPSVKMFNEGSDVTIASVSMSHMYGQDVYFLAGMSSGCTMIIMKSFSVTTYIDFAVTFRVTCAHLVPSYLHQLLKSPLLPNDDLSSLKKVETKAAHLNPQVIPLFKEKLPQCRLLKGYGMTEAMCLTKERMHDDWSDGSVGRLLPGVQVKIVDVESRHVLGSERNGELYFYSPALFSRYWSRTIQTFDESGFLKTDDIGYIDDQGRLFIVDRVNDLIKCEGELVSPMEIENIIATHEKVADVGVIGVHVENVGEAPRAFVVKKEEDLTEDEIYKHVIDRTAQHKRLLGGVVFIKSIPRLGSGKICRARLKAIQL